MPLLDNFYTSPKLIQIKILTPHSYLTSIHTIDLSCTIWVQCTSVTDRQTNRHCPCNKRPKKSLDVHLKIHKLSILGKMGCSTKRQHEKGSTKIVDTDGKEINITILDFCQTPGEIQERQAANMVFFKAIIIKHNGKCPQDDELQTTTRSMQQEKKPHKI